MAQRQLLIPVRQHRPRNGVFKIGRSAVLASPSTADVLPLKQLAGDITDCGTRSRIVRNAFGDADIRVRRGVVVGDSEAYRLTIAPDGIEIIASADAGAYYGLQTLRDMLKIHGLALPACVINDQPDFKRRGVYHDCSRGKVPTMATVKALVERLAHWKINELQLYVENVFKFVRHPKIGRGYSPFSAEDLLEIQEHCRLHHIRFVGSLASFGHMERILCLPQYTHLAELPGHMDWKGGTTLCPGDRGSIKLVEEMYEEFVPLFEAEDFNVCCDETWELGQGRSKARADRLGVGRVYLDFLLKIHRLCEKHGKRMNAWADIVMQHPELLKRMPKDAVMLNWEYAAHGERIGRTKEIVSAKLPLVVCPGTSSWQTHGTNLENAIANVANFAAEGRKCGAEGLLNTDWGDCGHRNLLGVSLHGFAHGAAHSWHGRGVDDATFTETFCESFFGAAGKGMASLVRKAGATGEDMHRTYFWLVESLKPTKAELAKRRVWPTRGGARKVISRLGSMKIPAVPKRLGSFEALTIKDMAMAARMDVLACRRALVFMDLHEGKAVDAGTLRTLAADMRCMVADFSKLWLARSRPSRLKDNLAIWRRGDTELRKLIRR